MRASGPTGGRGQGTVGGRRPLRPRLRAPLHVRERSGPPAAARQHGVVPGHDDPLAHVVPVTDDAENGSAVRVAWSRLVLVLRPLRVSDLPAVRDLVVAAGMFTAEEAAFLDDELGPLTRAPGPGDSEGEGDGRTCLVEEVELTGHPGALAGPPVTVTAVVYYRPEEAADRVWDLTMIAVHPAVQGRGTGQMLMRHAEADLSARGGRLLAVRTSGTGQYAGTRAFYDRCGYDRTAQVPDWWTDGDDLVLFTKRLMACTP